MIDKMIYTDENKLPEITIENLAEAKQAGCFLATFVCYDRPPKVQEDRHLTFSPDALADKCFISFCSSIPRIGEFVNLCDGKTKLKVFKVLHKQREINNVLYLLPCIICYDYTDHFTM